MDLNPCASNHGRAVHGIRNLLRYGIDCKAIVWNQAAEKCTFGDAIRPRAIPYTLSRDAIPSLRLV